MRIACRIAIPDEVVGPGFTCADCAPSGAAAHYHGPVPVASEDSAAAFIARRVALMLARSPSRLAAMISAARSGAFAAAARRKLAPGPWVKRCRTLLRPPGS